MLIHYFYLITLSFLLGVALATFFPLSLPEITVLIFFGFVFTLLWHRTLNKVEIRGFLFIGVFIMTASLGALRVDFAEQSFSNSFLSDKVGSEISIEGIVVSEPDVRAKNTMLQIETERDSVLVSVDKYQKINYGDVVSVTGVLEKPESFTTDLGRTFNYPGYLKAKGIEYKISFAEVAVLGSGEGNLIVASLIKFKQSFMQNLEQVISEPAVALGEGLLLGVKQALGEELELAFRKTGIIHIVVLSGYNIMLVVIFVMFILGYFLPPKPRVIAGVMAITLFALLVGLSATVMRASIMASLLLVVQVTGRVYFVLRGLLLAGAIMVLINPHLLVYDVGFQLSFLATLGLILIAPGLESFLTRVPNFIGIRGFMIATLATQVAVLPLLLYQIGELSVVAVLVNVLVLPMVPVAMLLTFLTGLVGFVSLPLSSLVAVPTYFSLTYINSMALWFAGLPFAAYTVPVFPFYLVILAYTLLGYFIWRRYSQGGEFGYSEMGEKLLRLNNKTEKSQTAKIDLTNWVIVEEKDNVTDLKNGSKKSDGKSGADLPSDSDTPIFFR